jgi:hypothetical protein
MNAPQVLNCTQQTQWTPLQTLCFSGTLVAPGIDPGTLTTGALSRSLLIISLVNVASHKRIQIRAGLSSLVHELNRTRLTAGSARRTGLPGLEACAVGT